MNQSNKGKTHKPKPNISQDNQANAIYVPNYLDLNIAGSKRLIKLIAHIHTVLSKQRIPID